MVHHLAKFAHIWLSRLLGTRSSIWGSSAVLREHSTTAAAWRCGEGLGIYRKGEAGGGVKGRWN
jgi:uncharacterized damage-inducible protein DinB